VRFLAACLIGGFIGGGAVAVEAAERTTEHFIIRARGATGDLQKWGERCEELRNELGAKWFGKARTVKDAACVTEESSGKDQGREAGDKEVADAPWSPRCLIVVHDNLASYLHAVPGGQQTVASAWVETEAGQVVTRQIDVRGDRADWLEGALAHEMVHVLAADRFIAVPMPRWAEEGMALLADPARKQQLHDVDFRRASASRRHFRLGELLAMYDYPTPERMQAFYGQSASIVRYLAKRGEPTQFVDFVEQALEHGYDSALQTVYGLQDVAELEAEWYRSLRSNQLAASE
jgi:hypothetical protein